MSEVVLKKELAQPVPRPRELGAVACAGCPFAQLGCPKEGTGDCPPPQVAEAKQAATLLEDDRFGRVWATEGGYQGVLEKPKELGVKPVMLPAAEKKPVVQPAARIERPKQVVAPKPPVRRGQSVGEFVAALLLPTAKAK